jgi:hypothetical protein
MTPALTGRPSYHPAVVENLHLRLPESDPPVRPPRRFVVLCRDLKVFSQMVVAIDSSKFKAVNSLDRSFTPAKIERRHQQ